MGLVVHVGLALFPIHFDPPLTDLYRSPRMLWLAGPLSLFSVLLFSVFIIFHFTGLGGGRGGEESFVVCRAGFYRVTYPSAHPLPPSKNVFL